MAATNLPDILDPALTRPGRFDRHVSRLRKCFPDPVEEYKLSTEHCAKRKLINSVRVFLLDCCPKPRCAGSPGDSGALFARQASCQ
jgi:ATP-dependent 26S proteasome regulatory subunit